MGSAVGRPGRTLLVNVNDLENETTDVPGRPAKIIRLEESGLGIVDYLGQRGEDELLPRPEARRGDWVIVHAGFAISVMDEKEARKTLRLFRELAETSADEGTQGPGQAHPQAPAGHRGEAPGASAVTPRIMEVCGTHTMALFKHGLTPLLAEAGVEMVSGPGCPVCITPNGIHEAAISLLTGTKA